ncbi:MAG: DUF6029 family protein [Bacteroidota bacterium]|nr:DUF6029 family protein [Bacteroidota bacterium]
MKKKYFIILLLLSSFYVFSQGQLSGDLMLNSNFYDKDTSIGANTSQYKHELSSAEAWMFLNYKISGFNFSVRYDLFNNSPLLDPSEVYTEQGLSFYSVNKMIGDLDITAGYFYDQFGTGIIFRAFEDRTLGLDYAINGIRLKYNFSDNFRAKAFTGKQKYRFGMHPQVLKGINIEKDINIKDKASLLTGAGLINRTIDHNTMGLIANEINSYLLEDRFVPKWNNFAATFYNTLIFKNINWYVEYAQKTNEAIKNKAGDKFIYKDGNVIYSSLNYSVMGFGLSLQYKKSTTFAMRTSPFMALLDGTINYMPPMSKQNSKALLARYSISAQEFGEEAFQTEATYSPNKKNTLKGNYSYVEDEKNDKLFSEINVEWYKKFSKKFKSTIGLQSIYYNKLVYENHLDNYKDGTQEDAIVKTITPYSEFVYKFSRKKSLRAEIEYLFTEQDHGDFLFTLLEYNIAPKFSFSVSDMINTKPKKLDEVKHYYNISLVYSHHQTRFQIGYMKQVEGVVCTGGICRVEPAFSGVKFNLTTSF